MAITGKTLIDYGYKPGKWFSAAIVKAEQARLSGCPETVIREIIDSMVPKVPVVQHLRSVNEVPFHMNIAPVFDGDAENIAKVSDHMTELMRVPNVVAGAVMPDACPSSYALGTIPVGGVIASKDIHPGMHSADICCSMAITMFDGGDGKALLDAGMKLSHFGGGGRSRSEGCWKAILPLLDKFENNELLRPIVSTAMTHFATQGDGNHFFYVGRVASTGQLALVTHHGSRGPGAMLYKTGMLIAEKFRAAIAPDVAKHNAWIPSESFEGELYWKALQIIREWTKANHFAIHNRVATALKINSTDRFWNEHNFVFRKTDGLYYHAKGATPAFAGFAEDDCGLTLIPLNMASPVLITQGLDADNGLGFAPHGAGRNFSRGDYMRRNEGKTAEEMFAEQTKGIDARAFCGVQDISELPGAYKDADTVRSQIDAYGLAKVIDTVEPIGSIMCGNNTLNAPWRKKRDEKLKARDKERQNVRKQKGYA